MQFDQLARMTGGKLHNAGSVARMFTGVSIDSRSVRPGELFVAISGDNFDGHRFISEAISKGAAGVVSQAHNTNFASIPKDIPAVAVDDCHEAMMKLAEAYRAELPVRIIGLTGSNGKTSTKEWTFNLIEAVEKKSYRSPGNLNNLFGMPLAIFAMPVDSQIAVMEMGISRPGEMTRLTRIVQPNIIVIINVGPSHLQYLKSVSGVAKAKLEMVAASPVKTPVIINADDEILLTEASKIRSDLITFGINERATFKPQSIERSPNSTIVTIDGSTFKLPLSGVHHIYNLLAAFAACQTIGIELSTVDTTKIEFTSEALRGERVTEHGLTFISDCYNANPDSVTAALTAFGQEKTEARKVLILGDMLELGPDAKAYHQQIGRLAAAVGAELLIGIGAESKHIVDSAIKAGLPSAKTNHFADSTEMIEAMKSLLTANDLVLIKASRGISLEKVIEAWKDQGGRG